MNKIYYVIDFYTLLRSPSLMEKARCQWNAFDPGNSTISTSLGQPYLPPISRHSMSSYSLSTLPWRTKRKWKRWVGSGRIMMLTSLLYSPYGFSIYPWIIIPLSILCWRNSFLISIKIVNHLCIIIFTGNVTLITCNQHFVLCFQINWPSRFFPIFLRDYCNYAGDICSSKKYEIYGEVLKV